MPSFSHSIELPQPPETVFPWLLDADKVPQWTSHLDGYEIVGGSVAQGSRVKQTLALAGGLKLDLEVTRYEPPRFAETKTSSNGVELVSAYTLVPSEKGTQLTQSLEGKAKSLGARMIIPVVQGRLEKKIVEDLEKLREVLGS